MMLVGKLKRALTRRDRIREILAPLVDRGQHILADLHRPRSLRRLLRPALATLGAAGPPDRPEDLEAEITELLRDVNAEVDTLGRVVARCLTDQKRLELEIEDHRARAAEWKSRAVLAVADGRDDLAREALEKEAEELSRAEAAAGRWQNQKHATGQLAESLRTARQFVTDTEARYHLLLARCHAAATRRRIATARTSQSHDRMQRLADDIRRLKATADATMDLAGDTTPRRFRTQFAAWETGKRVDLALQAIKLQLAERAQNRAAVADAGHEPQTAPQSAPNRK